jgi:DNA-binding GntR family transcriptional regulator
MRTGFELPGTSRAPRMPLIAELDHAPSLEERIAERLTQLITSGELPETARLRHRELAEAFGVSSTPIRASLIQLERDGLVVIGRTGRAIVSALSLADVEEIYAARRGMAALAARRGAPLLTEATLAEMAALLRELEVTATTETIAHYLEVTWRFHALCYRAASRQRLVDDVERLYWRAGRYHRLFLSTSDRFAGSVQFHARFFAACERRDGPGAELAIEEMVRWTVAGFATEFQKRDAPDHGR